MSQRPPRTLPPLRIAIPCERSWDELSGGGEQVRFCSHCEKRVFNLSAMTSAEGQALLKRKRAGLCVFYQHSADGTPVSLDQHTPPIGAQSSKVVVAAAALIALSGACTANEQSAESAHPVSQASSVECDESEGLRRRIPDPQLLREAEQHTREVELRKLPSTAGLPRRRENWQPCRPAGKRPPKGKLVRVIRNYKSDYVEERDLEICPSEPVEDKPK